MLDLKISRYTLIAGIGWILDFSIFGCLVHLGAGAGWSNLISAGVGVTWAYFMSTRHVFGYQGHFLWPKFMVYVGYQVLAVSLASLAVSLLQAWWPTSLGALAAKVAVTPFTYYANFVFMGLLLTHKIMWK
jgi:putative flippase GtrA